MKLKAQPQPLAIVTSYTPLITRFGIVATGGSRTQFYYTNENQFIPSRGITPLLLKAYLNVVDPDGVISTGDKSSHMNVHWYENSYDNQITSETSGFTINADGTLTVMKDVLPSSPSQILVRATYTDTRNSNILVFEDRMVLTSISKTDNELSVSLDKPAKITFNPIDDTEMIDITATLKLGAKVIEEGAQYTWYTVNNGTETLIDEDETALEYVSGQGSPTLRINANYTNFSIIRVKATNGNTDLRTPFADIVIVYSIPEVKAHIYSPNGSTLRSAEKSKTFKCVLHTSSRILTDKEAEKYFLIKWYRKPIVAGGTTIHIGDGISVNVSAADLKLTGRQSMNVYPTIYSRGAYGYLVNASGKVITDANNRVIITRT